MNEGTLRTEVAYEAVLACNRLLLAFNAVLLTLCISLACALGYALGSTSSKEVSKHAEDFWSKFGKSMVKRGTQKEAAVGEQSPASCARQSSITQDPAANIINPRLGSKEALKPVPSYHVQDLDSARQALLTKEIKDNVASLQAITEQEEVDPRIAGAPADLQEVYANYISRWQDNAFLWKEPISGRDSRLGSRVPSTTSDFSGVMTRRASSADMDWVHSALNFEPSGASVLGAQLLYSDWEISPLQIKFCYTSKGELIHLGEAVGGKQITTCQAVLDGKLNIAIKSLKLSRDAVPRERIVELAMQQLSLNSSQQLLQFYGICQADDAILLVYEYVEGGNMREAIRKDPQSMRWYANGKIVARDVALGLAYLHIHSVEHRNLKSSQVLVRSSDSAAKISDAGLQGIVKYCQESRNRRLAAAFDWAAPELLLGHQCGPEADIFAFGVVLWELITQEMPIKGALRPLHVPAECPASIRTLVTRCMAREPDQRPTAEEIIGVIQQAWNLTPNSKAPAARDGYPSEDLRSLKQLPSTSRKDPRGMCDSVTEMVDIRKGVAVRRGTLQSSQSAGGARSPLKKPLPLVEIAENRQPGTKPERRSANLRERRSYSVSPLRPKHAHLGASGERSQFRPFHLRQNASAVYEAQQTPTMQRFMSSKEKHGMSKNELITKQLFLERLKRSDTITTVKSDPVFLPPECYSSCPASPGCETQWKLNELPSNKQGKSEMRCKEVTGDRGGRQQQSTTSKHSAASVPAPLSDIFVLPLADPKLEEPKTTSTATGIAEYHESDMADGLTSQSSTTASIQSGESPSQQFVNTNSEKTTLEESKPESSTLSDPIGSKTLAVEEFRTRKRAEDGLKLGQSLQDDLSAPKISRVDRWRKKCDMTFTQWIGSDNSSNLQRSPSNRFGSLSFWKSGAKTPLSAGQERALRSEETYSRTVRSIAGE